MTFPATFGWKTFSEMSKKHSEIFPESSFDFDINRKKLHFHKNFRFFLFDELARYEISSTRVYYL